MREELREVASMIDSAALGAGTTRPDIDEMIRISVSAGFACVGVNPCYVPYAAKKLPKCKTRIYAVIGYPFGQQTTEIKVAEARQAVEEGTDELDMVANVGFFKDGRDREVGEEISRVVDVAGGRVVKVIIESCCLDKKELARIGLLVASSGARFVKTSSGFNIKGGTIEEVRLLSEVLEGRAGVKISGLGAGFTFDQALAFVKAGATRIGSRIACPLVDTIRKEMGID